MRGRLKVPPREVRPGTCPEFRLHRPRVLHRLPNGQRFMQCRVCGDTWVSTAHAPRNGSPRGIRQKSVRGRRR